jgi:dTDP-N-acetylfucosamine:lipid II N-acetylfucosaminyltransferase
LRSTPDGHVVSQCDILHLFGWDKKFVLPFMDLIHEHFADGQHKFIVYGDVEHDAIPISVGTVTYFSLLKNFLDLSKALHHADKIILHGLFSSHLLYILALQPWLLKKCYWVIWGGDLYVHESEHKGWRWGKNEFFRRFVIQRLGYLLTYIPGDVELARQWYGAKGQYLECLMYPSNIFTPVDLPEVGRTTTTTVLVGNSATSSNNHFEIFEGLCKLDDQNFKLICPLSYGDRDYAEKVSVKGNQLFGDRFVPLLNFMLYQDYLKILAEIDVAIFAHRRQQGMGNTIALLGLGKKIFIRSDVTQWNFLKDLGMNIFSISDLDFSKMNSEDIKMNSAIIKKIFSKKKLITQYAKVFS